MMLNCKYYHNAKGIIVCDIDGTISQPGDRLKYIQREPKDWDAFYQDSFNDKPIIPIINLVSSLYIGGYQIVFLTGRREECRKKTLAWLGCNVDGIYPYELIMRANDDLRSDVEVKPDLLNKFLAQNLYDNNDVAFMLEDRNVMCDRWRELGYTCLQVAEGDY